MTITRVYTFYYKGKEITLERLIEIIHHDGIRQVLLDLGGTIVDFSFETKEKMLEYINTLGPVSQDALELALHDEWDFRRKNISDQSIVESVNNKQKEKEYWFNFYASILARLEIRYEKSSHILSELVKLQMDPDSYEVYPIMKYLIDELIRLEIQLGLVSNAFPSSEKIFEYTGLQSKFHTVIFSHRCKHIKPNPEIYQLAVEQTNYTPDKILFIDDYQPFIQGAEILGIQGVQICVKTTRGLGNRQKGKQSSISSLQEKIQTTSPYMVLTG